MNHAPTDKQKTQVNSVTGVYILQLGYYRAVGCLFPIYSLKQGEDIVFILQHYFLGELLPKKRVSVKHHYSNRSEVLRRHSFIEPDSHFADLLLKEAKALARRHILPKFVLQELLAFCLEKNVVRPAYSILQGIVSAALKHEQKRLINKLYTEIDKGLRGHLDRLLDNDNLFHNLTFLKKDQKNFTTKEIRKSVAKQRMLIEIYECSLLLIPKLGISEQNIIYYANLAEFYTIQKMKQMRHKNQVRLYLLCYAHRRLLKINDHLITSFNYKVSQYIAQANEYQKTMVDTVEAVDKVLRDKACKVLEVNINKKIPDDQVREKAFEIVPEPDYKQFLRDFKKPNLNREYYRWECYGSLAPTISRNLRPLFKSLTFSCAKQEMSEAIFFLKYHLEHNRSFKSS